jgi:hypothetical protein
VQWSAHAALDAVHDAQSAPMMRVVSRSAHSWRNLAQVGTDARKEHHSARMRS